MAELVIRNEDQLFAAISQLQNGRLSIEGLSIKFDGWPNYRVTLRGDVFKGGLPIRKMSPFIKLQWAIDNYYSEQKYGIKKNLSDSDKQKTSVIVHFESGSTVASSSFYDILNQLGTELINKMDSTEAVIAFLGVAAILGGSWVLKAHINRLAEKDRLEANSRTLIEMSKQETERAKIIAEAASHNPTLQRRVDDISIVNDKLLKSLKPGEQLVQDGQVLIDGSSAKELTKPASKAEPIEDRLDGKFLTITVDSGSVRDGFRMTIRNIETKEVLTNVKVPAGTLTDEQVQTLQAGEWGKKPLFMQLNVRKSGNRIISATLIKAGLSEL